MSLHFSNKSNKLFGNGNFQTRPPVYSLALSLVLDFVFYTTQSLIFES